MAIKFVFSVLALIVGVVQLFAQDPVIRIKPYLQDAEPEAITIMWETNKSDESIVEWGTSPKLGKRTKGTAFPINYSAARVHEVRLTGLIKQTMYYYRVRTGKTVSDIYQFKTPPEAHDHQAFQLAAMSDMQIDSNNPEKFAEIVQDGILHYLEHEFEGTVPENLALVMIPGDLVSEGGEYYQWKEHFFDPAQDLFSEVPVYPVIGNHERNSTYYFKYFSLPKNGSPEHDEHWWYKDYGNVRIIGMDTNEEYQNRTQLSWLDDVLAKTKENEEIDFVFAQMHHPHKSELWLDGEEDYTGKIVKKLEAFSTETGKPSIHFFGHTHGYSRGQSRDHKHLWINVASAGGSIDNWGEFDQKNYDEFTVTQDEYGFVMVEVNPNNGDPKLTVKRFSQGNKIVKRDNELRDSITVWKHNKAPEVPKTISPVNSTISPSQVILKASDFNSDQHHAEHGASHWQVSTTEDFSNVVLDRWKQFEDWYANQNMQEGDDLTDEKIFRLNAGTTYYWRVRYRDKNLNWSDWSETAKFITE